MDSSIVLFGRLTDGPQRGHRFVAEAEATDDNVRLAMLDGMLGWCGSVSTSPDDQTATFVPDAPSSTRLRARM